MARPKGSKNRTLEQIRLEADIQEHKLRLKLLEASKKTLIAKLREQRAAEKK